jgi:hypothetical protein
MNSKVSKINKAEKVFPSGGKSQQPGTGKT